MRDIPQRTRGSGWIFGTRGALGAFPTGGGGEREMWESHLTAKPRGGNYLGRGRDSKVGLVPAHGWAMASGAAPTATPPPATAGEARLPPEPGARRGKRELPTGNRARRGRCEPQVPGGGDPPPPHARTAAGGSDRPRAARGAPPPPGAAALPERPPPPPPGPAATIVTRETTGRCRGGPGRRGGARPHSSPRLPAHPCRGAG